jgi:hypothetical protein
VEFDDGVGGDKGSGSGNNNNNSHQNSSQNVNLMNQVVGEGKKLIKAMLSAEK